MSRYVQLQIRIDSHESETLINKIHRSLANRDLVVLKSSDRKLQSEAMDRFSGHSHQTLFATAPDYSLRSGYPTM